MQTIRLALFKAHNDSKPVSLQNLKMCKNNKHNKITKLRLFLVSMFLTQHSCDLSIIVIVAQRL